MPAAIVAFLAALARLFSSRIGGWVAVALVYLGIGFATKELALDPFLQYLQDGFNGLPAVAAAWMAYLWIDVYCSVVFSAYVAATAKRVVMRRITP